MIASAQADVTVERAMDGTQQMDRTTDASQRIAAHVSYFALFPLCVLTCLVLNVWRCAQVP